MKNLTSYFLFPAMLLAGIAQAQTPSDTLVCEGSQVVFIIPGQPGATVQWQFSGDGVSYTDLAGKTGDTLDIPAITPGWYRAHISGPNCDPYTSDAMELKLASEPSAANAGPDISSTNLTVTLDALTPHFGTGMWQIISGAGGNIADPFNPTSDFTGQPNTNYMLAWVVSKPPCPSKSDTITVSIGAGVVLPTITCNNQTLYVHPADNSGPIAWGCIGVVAGAGDDWDGQFNTATIMGMCTQPNAAAICANLSDYGYSDWYLPAYNELECLRADAGTIGGFQNAVYWSSTEGTGIFTSNARYRTFPSGVSGYGSKNNQNRIRCVRK